MKLTDHTPLDFSNRNIIDQKQQEENLKRSAIIINSKMVPVTNFKRGSRNSSFERSPGYKNYVKSSDY